MDKNQWNKQILQNPPKSGAFLQSFQWGEFQSTLKPRVLDIIRVPNIGQILKIKLPLGKNYLYLPKGPLKNYFKDLEKLGKKERSLFIRFEPKVENTKWPTPKGYKKVLHSIPSTTLILDLKKSEEELLKEMTQKGRYNIRLSEKKGLSFVGNSHDVGNSHGCSLQDFWKLTKETEERQNIKGFSKTYYENLLKNIDSAYIRTVYFKNTPLASGLFIDFAGTTTYLFGASTAEYKNLMAPYFLHWNVIKEAKNKGIKHYDFWGINPEDSKNPNYLKKWEGITRFKKSFGGEIVSYPGTYEIPIRKVWYRVYRLMKLFR